ncbi:uncharacterized protein TNCT_517491 [Trichonephila clavata]|uniref:Uncharacterized protein n=1 Tax=Trichonephila clavata TaxID=2740835 RepID=A0A8X6HPW7_TRICU|nr:uncharacterized protein TNCT_517491 [Trichonephila clavata]
MLTIPETKSHIQIQIPVFQQNCAAKPIKCVDDCSFLCVKILVRCVGGVCVLQSDEPVKCNTEKGGMVMLAKNPIPYWMCLCTDATFWSGPECNTLNLDVCEHGALMYKSREDYMCICPSPYVKVVLKGKPHCLERTLANFFPKELEMRLVQEKIGPPALK